MNGAQADGARPQGKPVWWAAYVGFLLNGMGVVALGPLLPRLLGAWGLSDAAGGGLLAAHFLGQSVGSTFVLREQRRALAVGAGCAWAGMSALALLLRAGGEVAGVDLLAWVALAVYGYGLGQVITTLNLGVGAGATERAARISTGNGFWSVGAILAPVLVGVATSHLWWMLAGFALVFPGVWVGLGRLWVGSDSERGAAEARKGAEMRFLLLFVGLVFLYGGTEACLSGWLTTFARRAGGTVRVSPLSTSALWLGVALGRGLAGWLLRGWETRRALLVLVAGAAAASSGLLFADSVGAIAIWAGVCGLLLGPVFALLIAGTLDTGASSRQAGLVLAMSGMGGAVFPWVLGVFSQRADSLREALVVPGLCLAGIFVLVWGFVRAPGELLETRAGTAKGR